MQRTEVPCHRPRGSRDSSRGRQGASVLALYLRPLHPRFHVAISSCQASSSSNFTGQRDARKMAPPWRHCHSHTSTFFARIFHRRQDGSLKPVVYSFVCQLFMCFFLIFMTVFCFIIVAVTFDKFEVRLGWPMKKWREI